VGHGPVLQLREQDIIEMKKAAILANLEKFYGSDFRKWQQLLNKMVQDPRSTERDWIAGMQLLAEIKALSAATQPITEIAEVTDK
jgi:hypothetical protein